MTNFRIYYNHTLRPELIRLEGLRHRVVAMLIAETVLVALLFCFQIRSGILPLTFLFSLPLLLFGAFIVQKKRRFRAEFKSRIVRLILSFLEETTPNYHQLDYHARRHIGQSCFQRSKIFTLHQPIFEGEDLLNGKIGELDFECSELWVRQVSAVRSGFDTVFRGVFLHASWGRSLYGELLVLPRAARPRLTRSIREFVANGGEDVSEELNDPDFSDIFITFAIEGTSLSNLLSAEMRRVILAFRQRTDKEIYFSFVGSNVYAAVVEPRNLLEPFLFRSNVSYDLVEEYLESIQLMFHLVEDFNANN